MPVTIAVALLSGLGGGAAQLAGPAVIIYWPGGQNTAAVVRANLLVFFMLISIVILAVYLSQGLFTPEAPLVESTNRRRRAAEGFPTILTPDWSTRSTRNQAAALRVQPGSGRLLPVALLKSSGRTPYRQEFDDPRPVEKRQLPSAERAASGTRPPRQ